MDYWIYIIFFGLVVTDSEQCTMKYDKSNCRYDMYCIDVMDPHQRWDRFRHQSYNRGYPDYGGTDEVDDRSEECSDLVSYGGYTLDRVYLDYRQSIDDSPNTDPVPKTTDWAGQGTLNVIYSLNLSGNNYIFTPVIKSMQSLTILDLSRNLLTTAVLSNENDLNKLKEIDLSHNTIRDIYVNNYDHPYITLKKINISFNYLVKVPDAAFDRMDSLQILDLSHNYIEGLSPFTFEGIKHLLHLDLSYNRLTDINTFLFRFTELKVLKLSNNRLKELKTNDFEKLIKLELLDLSSNFIKTIDVNAFNNMIFLNSLDLSNNTLHAANKETFSNLQSLISIDLSRNKFKFLPKDLFKGKSIVKFSINDNLLEGSLSQGMFEGINVTTLDLSNQLLTTIEDYAFNDMTQLDELLLRDNEIYTLSNMCFQTLINLQLLDLSNNKIVSLRFYKADLANLKSLILRNNRLVEIKHDDFHALDNLEYLDLSENAISRLEPNSLTSLRNLLNLMISNNPLSGILEANTFEGLVSLPSLDISGNLLTNVQNASFNDMIQLKELNMSHCKIKEMQYNVFINTGYIETLDLTDNKLENLFLNMTDLVSLRILLLNNNLIKTISSTSLQGLSSLSKLSLTHNALESNIHNESFSSLVELRILDLSYNQKFKFTPNLLDKTKTLETLNLSGIKTDIKFTQIEDTTISDVLISDAGIQAITTLNLSSLPHISTLVLSKNNVSKLEIGDFKGLTALRHLDMSYNKISFIQPGTFKDNELLSSLNISHNSLTVIGYGIFRGLIYLDSLDLSYNYINDLKTERFYEVKSLSSLIVDYNKIETVYAEEFLGTSLKKLSIGDNPLPCDILVKLKKAEIPFEITAIKIDEHNGENIDGVTCNKNRGYESTNTIPPPSGYTNSEKNDILVDIRNILYNASNKNYIKDNIDDVQTFEKFTNVIEKLNTTNYEKLSNLANLTSKVIDLSNSTNILLSKILQALEERPIISNVTQDKPIVVSVAPTTVPSIGNNNNNNTKTIDPILYINKIKKELQETIAGEKQNVIKELESKFSLIQYQTESLPTSPSNEKLVSNNETTKSLFTETCVALILLILVGLVLYKVYKSRIFIRSRLSYSTRELPGAMENSNL